MSKTNGEGAAIQLPPALLAYIERVGAEQLNFRRYMVKQYSKGPTGRSYYTEKALITIDNDGKLKYNGPEDYQPTDDEREAIEASLKGAQFPRSVHASLAAVEVLRKKEGGAKDSWFIMLDQKKRKEVVMIQQRLDREDGGKDYIPWTLFSDGVWRRMEPGKSLPFWKPETKRNNRVMIHEGAKAARWVDWLCYSDEPAAKKARKTHPWYDFLQMYDHWGIIGGALAPHRANYEELHESQIQEVIYACDRDAPGEQSLQKVSQYYRDRMFGIRFDERFPNSWDMADPLPEEFFKDNTYVGPTLEELMQPATWATDMINTGERGRPKAVLRSIFKEEWCHAVTPEAYINRNWPSRIYYGADEFNNRLAPFSDIRNLAALVQKDDAGKVEQLSYSPAIPAGLYAGPPRSFNTHTAPRIAAKEGDASLWEEFLAYLFPVETDRTEVIRFCATLSEVPATKMAYGMLMCSETQGVGKTTLAMVMSALVGRDNTTFPSESEIVEGNFSDWKSHCRLVVVNEIYAGQSSKAYNKLKDVITDKVARVNRKFQSAYETENWAHVIACSNSMKALRIPDDDRRWLIPEVTESIRPQSFWAKLNAWLEVDGYAIVKGWLAKWLEENDAVLPGARAPATRAKAAMVEESYSPGQSLVMETLTGLNGQKSIVVTDSALIEKIHLVVWQGTHTDRLEKPAAIRRVAKACGWYVGKERQFVGVNRPKARLIANQPGLVELDYQSLKEQGVDIIVEVGQFGMK